MTGIFKAQKLFRVKCVGASVIYLNIPFKSLPIMV